MKNFAIAVTVLLPTISLSVFPAQAAFVNSLEDAHALSLPSDNKFTDAASGPGYSFKSTTSGSVFGWTARYGFDVNGEWNGVPMLGLNTDEGVMTLTFNSLVSGFGGIVNWSGFAPGAKISIFDQLGQLIESKTLSSTGQNLVEANTFMGFQLDSLRIKSVSLENAFIGIKSMQTSAAIQAVPGPEAGAGIGALTLGGMALYLKRRRKEENLAA
ncbi:hypothetical protein [Oryzifoliimicrobium ureilyticus]|uniref:hypothetical protein n=1 Tax=Oryzifoliimicrobium ureilyticus TaxID=3113724 RepID=UPI003076023E